VRADFHVINHGSIFTFRPLNDDAQQWWDDNVDPDALSFGGAYAVEPRYAVPLIEGICDEGFTVQ
jgi:hypothetical protein